MPHFYTTVMNDNFIDEDKVGEEFETTEAAVANARQAAVDMLEQHLATQSHGAAFKIYVKDADRGHVATISVMGLVAT